MSPPAAHDAASLPRRIACGDRQAPAPTKPQPVRGFVAPVALAQATNVDPNPAWAQGHGTMQQRADDEVQVTLQTQEGTLQIEATIVGGVTSVFPELAPPSTQAPSSMAPGGTPGNAPGVAPGVQPVSPTSGIPDVGLTGGTGVRRGARIASVLGILVLVAAIAVLVAAVLGSWGRPVEIVAGLMAAVGLLLTVLGLATAHLFRARRRGQ